MYEVPEMKLLNYLLLVKRKNTMMKRQCVGHTLFFSSEATPLQHNLVYVSLLVLV